MATIAFQHRFLQASAYAAQYQPFTDPLKPKILQAALWMTQPAIEQAGRQKNLPYTHRRYLVTAALGETGILTGNPFLVGHSWDYIREGINLQDLSGFNPEKGGYDCSYPYGPGPGKRPQ